MYIYIGIARQCKDSYILKEDIPTPRGHSENKLLHKWIKPSGIPAVTLLDENMKIVNFASRGLNTSFDRLLEILDE